MTAPSPVTVLIPSFNRADLVVRAIECALGQTQPDDEVLVVDDGSTDDTAARLERFAGRVRVLRQANAGAAAARNAGLAAARHRWVAFLDSDDLWEDGHLAGLRAAIAATNGACALYFGDVRVGDGEPTWWDLADLRIEGAVGMREEPMPGAMAWRQPMAVPSCLVARARALEAGGFPPLPIREDTFLFFRMCLRWPACAVRGAGVRVTGDAGAERLTSRLDAFGT